MSERMTYRALQLALKKKILARFFQKGAGGPLLLLWIVGAGTLGVFFDMTTLALLWAAVCPLLGLAGAYSSSKDLKFLKEALREIIEERFALENISRSDLTEALSGSMVHLLAVATKILEFSQSNTLDENLKQVLADADSMMTLQFESARQVEEFDSVLRLVSRVPGRSRSKRDPADREETSRLLRENIEAVEKACSEALESVREIGEKMEILVLQVARMGKLTSEMVRTAQVAEETTSTLKRLQAVVNTRRETADEIIRRITPQTA